MKKILIGIDDTDNQTSRGTGHLARQLFAECRKRGMEGLGVTRHQFLLDERIPFTSHNSGACIGVKWVEKIGVEEFVFDFVQERSAEGSDPGVCVAVVEEVNREIVTFSQRATYEIVTMAEAYRLAESAGIQLRGLGGMNLGVIGALSSVGLRAGGNEGRFIDLPGLRELPELAKKQEITDLGIGICYEVNERKPVMEDIYATLDWVRPRLIDGRAVWVVKWSESKNAWIPIDRKKRRPLE